MKIISFSLWGDDLRYTGGAIQNVKLAKHYYPDWVCRFFVGRDVGCGIIAELSSHENSQVVEMDTPGNWTSMFWRFYPASDPDVDIMICRDSDSRLGKREAHAVKEWVESDNGFHIMRDHPYHKVAICGGMWGAKRDTINEMADLSQQFKKENRYNTDQEFLQELIYPRIKNNCTVHDEFFDNKPFPESSGPRDQRYFVGQAYAGDGSILDTPQYGTQYYQDYLKEHEGVENII